MRRSKVVLSLRERNLAHGPLTHPRTSTAWRVAAATGSSCGARWLRYWRGLLVPDASWVVFKRSPGYSSNSGGMEDEVVRAGLRQIQKAEKEVFPPSSLQHLYTRGECAAEAKLAQKLPVPQPDEV